MQTVFIGTHALYPLVSFKCYFILILSFLRMCSALKFDKYSFTLQINSSFTVLEKGWAWFSITETRGQLTCLKTSLKCVILDVSKRRDRKMNVSTTVLDVHVCYAGVILSKPAALPPPPPMNQDSLPCLVGMFCHRPVSAWLFLKILLPSYSGFLALLLRNAVVLLLHFLC